MRKAPIVSVGITLGLFASLVLLGPLTSLARADDSTCGDQGLSCGAEERCCTHITAIFSDSGASSPAYRQGQCIPKEQRCSDYWCGNRHCRAGFFGLPSVCCIKDRPGLSTEYRCAYSELSCPGNTQRLSIRTRSGQDGVLASNILPPD